MICLSTTHGTTGEALEAARRNASWLDLMELRVDFLTPGERESAGGLPRLLEEALGRRVAVICTLRRARDGGRFSGTEAERLALLRRILSGGGFDFLDLEEDLLGNPGAEELVGDFAGRVIRSHHAPEGLPEDLPALYRRLAERPEEIPKIAVAVSGSAEAHRVFELMVATRGRERIILAMGEYGFPTRILGRKLGCFLTYTSDLDVPGQEEAAPGHLSPRALSESYRYREIDGETKLFGIIGNPVLHSKSPAYHTAAFREGGFNGLYVPFPVDDLEAFFRTAELLSIQGLSVTIPHKEGVRRFLSGEEPAVAGAGACNTVLRRGEGWHGTNTDVRGFLEPLRRELGALSGLRATVIGAGGAARGAVYALVSAGADVLVLNRTVDKARRLARDIPGAVEVGGLDGAGIGRSEEYRDIIVQTTSVGMAPEVEGDPAPALVFKGSELVYDLIYTPEETRFLRRAREAGCRVLSGIAMFRRQAELQQELFRSRFQGPG